MDAFRQWAVCLIIAAAAGTFAMAVSPRGSMDKTIRAVVGIFVIAAVCSPLAEMKNAEFSVAAISDSENCYGNSNTSALRKQFTDMCSDAVASSVKETAAGLGITVGSVEAEISVDSDNCIIIHNVLVKVTGCSDEKSEELLKNLQDELGVPVTVAAQ